MESDGFLEAARYLGATDEIAQRALANLETRQLVLLAVNGWLAAGKDTVAPAVLERLGVEDAVHLYYALPLKDQLDEVIRSVSDSSSPDEAIEEVTRTQGVPPTQAAFMVGLLWLPTREAGNGLTARHRTKETRTGLQYWGTEVRRRQDPDYWVKRALHLALLEMAEGRSVYFTDVRFPNEVVLAQSIGFTVVRVEITREEQRLRLLQRDGIEPDPATIYHESETGLDTYQGFDLVVDNNGPADVAITAIADFLQQNRQLTK